MSPSLSLSLPLLHFHVRTLCGFHGTLTHSTRRNATPGGVERPYACSHVGHSMNSPPRVPRARHRSYGISCRLAGNAFIGPLHPPPSRFYFPPRSREYSNLSQISVTLRTPDRACRHIIFFTTPIVRPTGKQVAMTINDTRVSCWRTEYILFLFFFFAKILLINLQIYIAFGEILT